MILLVACILLLSTPLPSIGGSDDPASPPMDEVNNGTSPIKMMNDTELVSAVPTCGWSGNGSADDPYIIENLTGQITRRIGVQDTTRPNAVAGDDITVLVEEGVYLNASLSTDDVGIVTYEWSIVCDHNSTSLWFGMVVGVAFHHEGVFNITLTVWDAAGNSDEDHMVARVGDFEPPVAVIGEDLVIDQHTTLGLNGTASTDNWMIVAWNWTITSPDDDTSLNNTREITHTFDEAGVHTVTLRVTDPAGLWNETTINVTVLDTTDPLAMLGVNTIIDMGETFHLNGTSSGDNVGVVNWTWSVEGPGVNETYYGPEANHTFPDAGVYAIILNVTDAAGNWDSNGIMVTVRDTQLPVANAGNDVTVDEGTLVVLNATASTDNVGIDTYMWSFFYDGRLRWIPSPSPTYSFTFDIPGIYTITLNVTDAMVNVGTDQLIITVLDITPPVANAGENMVVDQHTTVTFSSPMSSDNVAIVDITWTFEYDGEERVLTGTGSEFTFDLPGVYTVTLVVSDAAGHTVSDTLIITVEDTTPPVAVAGEDVQVKVGGTVRFNGSASSDNLVIVEHMWMIDHVGEPQTHFGPILVVTFENLGEYYVTLVVTDVAGNTGNDTLIVTVVDDEGPVAVAGDDITIDQGQRLDLDGSGSSDNVGVVEWSWSLDDGGTVVTLSGPNPNYVFNDAGGFIVELMVTDASGNSATDTIIVTVRDTTPPVADAGNNIAMDQHEMASFDGTGSTDNVAVMNWTWSFSYDGTDHVLYGSTSTFILDRVGTYDVTLEVRDEFGNLGSDTVTVSVADITAPLAVAGLDPTVNRGEEVTLAGSASTDNVGVVSWTWTFETPDGPIIRSGETFNWTFHWRGDNQIRLTVTDGAGNENSTMGTIVVLDTTHGDGPSIWVDVAIIAVIAVVILVSVVATIKVIRKRS